LAGADHPVGVVVGVDDVEVWLLVGLSEENDIAGGVRVALGIGMNSESWGHPSEDWGLEGVVDLEGASASVEVVVLGGLALVGGWLLWVVHVHLLVPGSDELGGIKSGEWGNGVTDNGVSGEWSHHSGEVHCSNCG